MVGSLELNWNMEVWCIVISLLSKLITQYKKNLPNSNKKPFSSVQFQHLFPYCTSKSQQKTDSVPLFLMLCYNPNKQLWHRLKMKPVEICKAVSFTTGTLNLGCPIATMICLCFQQVPFLSYGSSYFWPTLETVICAVANVDCTGNILVCVMVCHPNTEIVDQKIWLKNLSSILRIFS